VALERQRGQLDLITQNVDGLHQRAGSMHMIELHGSLHQVRCAADPQIRQEWSAVSDGPPRCPHCSSWMRQDIVWSCCHAMRLSLRCWPLLRAICSCRSVPVDWNSGLVEPVASLPLVTAKGCASVAVINRDVEPLSSPGRYEINGKAGLVLPVLVQAAWPDVQLGLAEG